MPLRRRERLRMLDRVRPPYGDAETPQLFSKNIKIFYGFLYDLLRVGSARRCSNVFRIIGRIVDGVHRDVLDRRNARAIRPPEDDLLKGIPFVVTADAAITQFDDIKVAAHAS